MKDIGGLLVTRGSKCRQRGKQQQKNQTAHIQTRLRTPSAVICDRFSLPGRRLPTDRRGISQEAVCCHRRLDFTSSEYAVTGIVLVLFVFVALLLHFLFFLHLLVAMMLFGALR